jgi:hypothetical protein
VNLAVCASADTTNVFDIGDNALPGGNLEDPVFLYSIREPGVDGLAGRWHSATFSANARIIILGWEPGGGALPECEATDPPVKKSLFFYDATNGAKLGQWVLPRPQTAEENCTIHNYNVVPFADRHILVGGHYQAGVNWVDFTNPGAAFEFAWTDPPPLTPTQLAGIWSGYWYNDNVWDSDITTGLRGYTLTEPWWPAAFDITRLNPQTTENLLRCTVRVTTSSRLRARRPTTVTIRATERGGVAAGQPVALQRVVLRGPGVRVTTRTNMSGVARIRGVAASRAGTLRATVPTTLNMSGCAATRRIAAAPRPTRPPVLTGRTA